MDQPLLAAIYAAAARPEQWQAVLARMGAGFSASGSFLFTSHSSSEPSALLVANGMDDLFVPDFQRDWIPEDAWAGAAIKSGHMRAGSVITGRELVAPSALRRTGFYNDFLRVHGIEEMLGSVIFDGSEGDGMPHTNLCWYRSPGSAPFSRDDMRHLQGLLPHFRQALQMHYRMRELDLRRQLDDSASTTIGLASYLLDDERRILQCNGEAARTLAGGTSPLCCSGRQILRLGRACVPALPDAIRLSRQGPPARLLMQWGRSPCDLVSASVTALPVDSDCALGPQQGRRYLLLVELPRGDCEGIAERAAQLFKLTGAERRVLALTLDGSTPAAIARRSGTTLNTVRSQLKSIMAKLGVRRQLDVLRLLASL